MKIAAGTVSFEGYGNPYANDNLLNIYQQILNESNKKNVDLLCLPGGYLRARSREDKEELAKSLVEKAKNYKIAIAVGVDIGNSKKSKQQKLKKINSSNNFSAFAICWSPKEGNKWYCWKQRSSTSSDYKTASNKEKETYREHRTLLVGDGAVEILLCGELFNPCIRNNIIGRSDNITAVVVLSHEAGGSFNRAIRSMETLAKGGLVTLCTIHANSRGTLKRRCNPPGKRKSTPNSDKDIDGPPWIELKFWDV